MDKESAIEVARYLEQLLIEAGICVDQTILFGSCARNEAHQDSDVDIAIISEDFSQKDFFERSAMTNAALTQTIRQFLVPVDLLKFTPEEYAYGTSIALQFVRANPLPLSISPPS